MEGALAFRFGWGGGEAEQSHGYLSPSLFGALDRHKGDLNIRRILDVGCGNGSVTAKIVAAGYEVVGVEPSQDGVEHARRSYPGVRVENLSGYDDLKTKLGQFDAAVCLEVIEHLYSPHQFLKNVHDAVAPGGLLIISTPYHGYLKNIALSVAGKWDFHHHPLREHGHIKFWSRKTLETLLRDVGWRPIEFHRLGRTPPLAKSMMLVATKSR